MTAKYDSLLDAVRENDNILPTTYSIGDILFANTTSSISKLSVGGGGNVLTLVAGLPAWTSPSVTNPAGGNGEIQFNNSGAFGASLNLTFDGTNLKSAVSIMSPLFIGGTGTISSITYKTTSGVGTTGADHIFLVGNNGATEAMRIANNGTIGNVIFRSPTNSASAFQFLTQYAGTTLVIDTVNRRVGIGGYASPPGTTLHVQEDSIGQAGFYVVNSGTGGGSQASFLCGSYITGARYAYFSHFGANWTADGLWIASRSILQGGDTGGLLLHTHNATSGHLIFATGGHAASNECARFDVSGRMGLSGSSATKITAPTALLHIAAGTETTPPLRLTSGTLTTGVNILAGNVEFLTDKAYITITTGTAVKEVTLNDIALTSGRIIFATTNGRLTDSSTLTYTTTAGIITTKDITIGSDKAYYLGDSSTDGTWRIIRNGTNLSFDRRETGVYVSKGQFIA